MRIDTSSPATSGTSRIGLQILNYVITSNHVHLLVKDSGPSVIANSMQLVAGRTAQECNRRKRRKGAFGEDRYHATAVGSDTYLHRCVVYIDLNMVRAGVVKHPSEWKHGGFNAIQRPPQRYALIDVEQLATLSGFGSVHALQSAHRQWITDALACPSKREEQWSESVAVGDEAFVEKVQRELGIRGRHRDIEQDGDITALRERANDYELDYVAGDAALRLDNTYFWDQTKVGSDG